MPTSVLDSFRQPEYTGENRCVPCTVANVVIAAVLGVAVAAAWALAGGPLAWLVGGAILFAGLTSVWLRGYLVPGTPELTKRYFPDRVLAAFDKGPGAAAGPGGFAADAGATAGGDQAGATAGGDQAGATAGDGEAGATAGGDQAGATAGDGEAGATGGDHREDGADSPADADAETLLLSAGVVEPCEHEDDLCLVEAFRSGWHDRMGAIREGSTEREGLARELDVDPDTIEFEDHGDAFVARTDGRRLGQWESRAALVADLAAARELPDWIEDWDDLPVAARSQLLGGLRIFLESCPVCGGPVSAGMETVESCCRSHDVVAANCEECESRLLEVTYREPA